MYNLPKYQDQRTLEVGLRIAYQFSSSRRDTNLSTLSRLLVCKMKYPDITSDTIKNIINYIKHCPLDRSHPRVKQNVLRE